MIELASGLPEDVSGDESLARFVMSSRHYNSQGVKFEAFLPNPKNGETSVFRYTEEADDAVRAQGLAIANSRNRQVHGMSLVRAQIVFEVELAVIGFEPPPRHANITGWPTSPTDKSVQKAQQKERAMVIAQFAVFERF